ncbi:DUF2854 domain-containing protein [Tumidithrix helvetica PCC 7403]|uniref:DUF2854 domain-containing protein n=1 Tax=Tumidithrix helvetica TaxID=3457545 RepID=UPI003C8F7B7A
MLRKVSLASVLLLVGASLSLVGFFAYAQGNSTLNLVGFFYGIPILLGGAALKSSEVKPVKVLSPASAAVVKLRETQATSTQNQVRKDVTRYRYGIEAHLDQVLDKLGLSPTDEERPVLSGLYEEISASEATQGAYSLVLRFNSPLIGWDTWQQKQEKFTRFFGPGVLAHVLQPEDRVVDLYLTALTGESAKEIEAKV